MFRIIEQSKLSKYLMLDVKSTSNNSSLAINNIIHSALN